MSSEELAKALFCPDTVALVGASKDITKNSARPQRYLANHGFAGTVYIVNSKRKIIQGVSVHPDVNSLPGSVDHLFIMVPAPMVKEVLGQAVCKKVKVVTVYSDGFAEMGRDGAKLQLELIEIANGGGVRLLGPNSMGVIDTSSKLTLSVNAVLEMPTLLTGDIGLVSQSGTILGTLISRGQPRNIGFSKLVSVGNESDLGVAEIAELLVDDPKTNSIILFLEAIRDPDAIAKMARRAYTVGKPVFAYKLGRSKAGRQLAMTHSGAIAGHDDCIQAFLNNHGIIRVGMLEELLEVPALFQARQPASGKRVSIMTTTGGGAAMIADRLGVMGLELVGPTAFLRMRLKNLGLDIGSGPVIDLTMAGTKEEIYGLVLNELLQNTDCDAVIAVVGSSGQFHPEIAVLPIINADQSKKFLAAFLVPEATESLRKLAEAGVAAFRTPEACANAISAALSWQAPQSRGPKPDDMARVNILLKNRQKFNEKDSAQIFSKLNILQSKFWTIENDGIPAVEYPVALKILASGVSHKSDIGGVRLNLKNLEELKDAVKEISENVSHSALVSKPYKFLVQPMETGMAEVLLGYRRDPEVGPVIILGTGGMLTEIYKDFAIRLAPVDKVVAMEMIKEVKGLALVRGYRSGSKGDLNALASAIVNMSKLVFVKDTIIVEAEINPLIVKENGAGVVAIDGFIVTENDRYYDETSSNCHL